MDTPAEDVDLSDETKDAPVEPVEFKLRRPTRWGKGATGEISVLTLRPTPRAMKDLTVTIDPATGKLDFKPYDLARVGFVMAGYPPAVVDTIDHRDVQDLAMAVLGFFG